MAVSYPPVAFGASNIGQTAGDTGTSLGTWVLAGSTNITVSESTAVGGPNTIWLSAASGGGGGGAIGVSNTGTTAGNTGTFSVVGVFAASGNITASQSTQVGGPNTIWYSVPAQSNQPAVNALGVSNTGTTLGNTGTSSGITWVIAASGNVTASESTAGGGPNTIWISVPAQTSQSAIQGLGISNTGNTLGNTEVVTGKNFVVAASGGVTASQSTAAGQDTLWISVPVLVSSAFIQPVSTASAAGTKTSIFALADHAHAGVGALGVSNTGTTAGNTGTSAVSWVFGASGNITASQSTQAGGVNTIWYSVPAQTNQSAVKAFGVSNTGTTAGNTGVSTGVDWVIAASGNVTASESTAGGGPNTIWISVPAQTSQSAIRGFGASNTGNTAGNTGISTGVDWVIAGTQNITVSESTAGGGPNTIWISASIAGTLNQTGPNIGVSNLGNTAGSTGTISTGNYVLVGSSGITLSQSTAAAGSNGTVTIIGPGNNATVSWFEYPDAPIAGTTLLAPSSNTHYVFPFVAPEYISVSYIRFPASFGLVSTSFATSGVPWSTTFSQAVSANVVIYTQNTGANSRSVAYYTSAQARFTYQVSATGAGATNNWTVSQNFTWPQEGASTNNQQSQYPSTLSTVNVSTTGVTNFTGWRYMDVPFAGSLTPGNYWMALNFSTATGGGKGLAWNISVVALSQSNQAIGNIGAATNSTLQFQMGIGSWTTNVGGTTSSIGLASISSSANQPRPYFQFIRQA